MMNTAVGNGSVVNVKYNPYEWEFAGRKGIGANLNAIQVVDLVPYSGGDLENELADFEVVTDGFSTEDSDEDITLAS